MLLARKGAPFVRRSSRKSRVSFVERDMPHSHIHVSVVSAERMKKILEECPNDIEKAVFIPPKLGSNSFGKFSVRWRRGAVHRVS